MRTLLISNFFPPHDVGGAEISAYNTCTGLQQRGVEASVLSITARTHRRDDAHYMAGDTPVHRVTFASSLLEGRYLQAFDPRVFRAVWRELLSTKPDVVHIHNVAGASLAPFLACRRRRVPVVTTLHDHWLICPNSTLYQGEGRVCDPGLRRPPCKQCFRKYDFWGNVPLRRRAFARAVADVRTFISPSQALVDLHVRAGYDPGRFRVILNGITPGPIRVPSDASARRIVEECGQFPTILFSGFVSETKGIGVLIEALPKIVQQVPNLRLVVAGQGDERLMKTLREMPSPRPMLLGRLPSAEVRSLYAASDLIVVPSVWYENSPMVISESALAGTPTVGSAIGGIPELVVHEETGYLFAPGNAAALADQVIRHFRRPAHERRAMRRRCAAHAQGHFTLDTHIDHLLPVYRQAMRA